MEQRRKVTRRTKLTSLGSHSGPLRLVAFSDYRVQDIELLIEELSKLQPPADLVLYAGDDIRRFRPPGGKNLFELIASRARYGLCVIAGNDDEPSVRKLISGKSVFNVHLAPVKLGNYGILGLEGSPYRRDLEGIGYILHSEREIARHLVAHRRALKGKRLVVVSHSPPEGVLDEAVRFSLDRKPRSIGSRALRSFLRTYKNVALVVCGHVHRCGGMHKKFGHSLVVNAANHDDYSAVGRYAIIDLGPSGRPTVQWRQIRETSVVPRIGSPSAERLRNIGIRTVEELANASVELLQRVPHLGHSPKVLHARARAMAQNKPILIRPPELPRGPALFLDIETDLGQRYIWLVGICAGRHGGYKSFFAETPEDEKQILLRFLDFGNRFPAANILTCSGCEFERRVIRNRLSHHGLPTSVCDRIVDLHWILQPSVALPTDSYRVKEVGGFFGYRYKHPEWNGFAVASLYESRYQSLKKETDRRKLAQKLIEYNEDDVRCLPFILDAIDQLARQVSHSP